MFTVKYRESHYVTYWTCMKDIQTSTFHKTRILKSCLSLQKKVFDKFELTGITNDNRGDRFHLILS